MNLRALTALLVVALPAWAEQPAHFHLLTEQLTQRLTRSSTARFAANLESVAIYRHSEGHTGGTAYLVTAREADGTALVLSNHHVALFDDHKVRGDMILFHPGGDTESPVAARVLGVELSSKTYDYALLRVQLPEELASLAPVRLARKETFAEGERVYNPAFPRFVEGEARTPKRLEVGRADGEEYDGLASFFLPNRPGSSGSPVFSTASDSAVGMMNAGAGDSLGLVRPMGRIVADIEARVHLIADATNRARVSDMLRRVRRR